MTDNLVPMRCRKCGNAMLLPREEHETGLVRETITSYCNLCDDGERDFTTYRLADGREVGYPALEDILIHGEGFDFNRAYPRRRAAS